MNFNQINQLKQELDGLRPLPSAAVRNLDEVYRVEWTYNSNAIEGNTLTLLETKLVLEEGLTIGGKKLREHVEVINPSEAIADGERENIGFPTYAPSLYRCSRTDGVAGAMVPRAKGSSASGRAA
ncbi:hypothetical protein J2T17_002254 [Paenibacillus mucilaginosus]